MKAFKYTFTTITTPTGELKEAYVTKKEVYRPSSYGRAGEIETTENGCTVNKTHSIAFREIDAKNLLLRKKNHLGLFPDYKEYHKRWFSYGKTIKELGIEPSHSYELGKFLNNELLTETQYEKVLSEIYSIGKKIGLTKDYLYSTVGIPLDIVYENKLLILNDNYEIEQIIEFENPEIAYIILSENPNIRYARISEQAYYIHEHNRGLNSFVLLDGVLVCVSKDELFRHDKEDVRSKTTIS